MLRGRAGDLHLKAMPRNGDPGKMAEQGIEATERRNKSRRRVLKRALIVFNGGHCSMRCQILNISEVGAQVMPSDILLCTSEFVLKPDVGDQRNCEVAWRKGTTIGVRFV